MDRILSDNVGYDAQGRRIFKDGPPATTINDQWCNGIQEELMSMIESEGFVGSFSDNTLLLKAVTSAIARATDNYVVVHDLGTKNIVSANSSFNLDLYISGGTLAKPNGWKCKFRASNGMGTSFFNLTPSTIYNINGISALNWRIFGTGELSVELDNTAGNWNIINDSDFIFDEYQITDSGYMFDRIVKKKIKNEIYIRGKYFNDTVAINIATNNSFRCAALTIVSGITGTNNFENKNIHVWNIFDVANEVQNCLYLSGTGTTTGFDINFWRDASGTNLDCHANFECWNTWR
jgi:hypothetical protein